MSATIDIDAMKILEKIAVQDKRSVSNALNMILYDAGQRRGLGRAEKVVVAPREPGEGGGGGE